MEPRRTLFDLVMDPEDGEARWRLAYDRQQWMTIKRKGKNWDAYDFIGSHTGILLRCIRERGLALLPEAKAKIALFTPSFLDWIKEQPEWVAPKKKEPEP